MAILYSKELTTATKLPPVGFDLMQEIITALGVQTVKNSTENSRGFAIIDHSVRSAEIV